MVSRLFGPSLVPQGSDPLGFLQREVNRAFDEVFRGFPAAVRGAAGMGGFAPTLDVREAEGGLEIAAELPGMSEDDVELRLEGDLLTLSGEKKEERTREDAGLHLTERSFGRFQRSFRLPYSPDPSGVRAEFDRGVLRIALPRPQQQKSGGRIQIQPARGSGSGEGVASAGTGTGGTSVPANANGAPPSAGASAPEQPQATGGQPSGAAGNSRPPDRG
ncbi:Hsp20/alpha crystallin family protein [Muricoccus vinaceus]|uniref:Hsp20/alpha crystallin family protein n=1 Tax=Muricoccus vinaceus TaxID=424704 RepID=A0ABV6IU47_9PROT